MILSARSGIAIPYGGSLLKPSAFDAFARARVSSPQTIFDAKQVFDDNPDIVLKEATGGATIAWNSQRSSSLLTVPAAAGGKAIRQSRSYLNYQPGKSQYTDVTFVFGPAEVGLRRRAGYFDANNGLFLEQFGPSTALVARSDVSGVIVDTPIAQVNWSQFSYPRLDLSRSQVFFLDFEWLGAGTARFGFVTDLGLQYVHQILNANHATSVYMRTPNLPVRWEIERVSNGAAPSTLESICATVVSEGGQNPLGVSGAVDRLITPVNITAAGGFRSVIAIRLKAAQIRRTIKVQHYDVYSATAGNSLFRLLLNPTRGVGTAPNWLPVTNRAIEYDVTSTEILTGGIELDAGYRGARARTSSAAFPTKRRSPRATSPARCPTSSSSPRSRRRGTMTSSAPSSGLSSSPAGSRAPGRQAPSRAS